MFNRARSASPFRRAIPLLVFAATMILVAACATLATDDEIGNAAARMAATEEAQRKKAEALPIGSPERLAAEAKANETAERRAELDAAKRGIDESNDAAKVEAGAVQGVLSVVPAPGFGAAGSVVGLAWGAWAQLRSSRWRRIAKQIIDGFEKAQEQSPQLAEAIQASTDAIHSAMDQATIATVKTELRALRTAPGRVDSRRDRTVSAVPASTATANGRSTRRRTKQAASESN